MGDVNLLFEIGALRHINRMWQRFGNPDFANLAEHHFRTAWTALVLAKRHGKADLAKVLQLALIHDIGESRTGDVDYVAKMYVTKDDDKAMSDMLDATTIKSEIMDLWHEYEKRESIESKIVKDADILDVQLELKEQEARGVKLRELWSSRRNTRVKPTLLTKEAAKLWDEIEAANPNEWHVTARNRYRNGDWKKQ